MVSTMNVSYVMHVMVSIQTCPSSVVAVVHVAYRLVDHQPAVSRSCGSCGIYKRGVVACTCPSSSAAVDALWHTLPSCISSTNKDVACQHMQMVSSDMPLSMPTQLTMD